MTDPTPLEQAHSLYALLLTETFRCFCRMDGQREQVIRVDTAINLFMTYLAGLAATTPEPARLSAEATALAAQLNLYADRACDADHPDGWLESWTEECVETVRRAAILLRALSPAPPQENSGV